MRKIVIGLCILFTSLSVYASGGIGIVKDEDFIAVGVKQENLDRTKLIIEQASIQHQRRNLEKRALEIEINKYILDGTEKNMDKINELLEQVGFVDASIIKDRLKYQIEVQKYVSTEEYLKARDLALKRMMEQ